MNTKTRFLSILITLFFSTVLLAQTITGKITDATGVIPFANVTIKDNQYKIITGTTTDDDGLFKLKISKGSFQ